VVATRFRWPRTGHDAVIAWSADGERRPLDVDVPVGRKLRWRTFPVPSVMAGECCPAELPEPGDGRQRLTLGSDAVFLDFVTPGPP
jgi:hypothetical protein